MSAPVQVEPRVSEVRASSDDALITGIKVLTHRIRETSSAALERDLRVQRGILEAEALRRMAGGRP